MLETLHACVGLSRPCVSLARTAQKCSIVAAFLPMHRRNCHMQTYANTRQLKCCRKITLVYGSEPKRGATGLFVRNDAVPEARHSPLETVEEGRVAVAVSFRKLQELAPTHPRHQLQQVPLLCRLEARILARAIGKRLVKLLLDPEGFESQPSTSCAPRQLRKQHLQKLP